MAPSNDINGNHFSDVTKANTVINPIEKVLKKSEKSLLFMINAVPDIIYKLDAFGNIIFINKAIENYGYSIEELQRKSILDIIHEDDKELAEYKIRERRTGDRSTKDLEIRFVKKDNTSVPFEHKSVGYDCDSTFLINAEGLYRSDSPQDNHYLGTLGIARDITERKKTEKALRDSEKKFRTIFDHAGDALFINDFDGKFLEVNKVACEKLNYKRDDLLKMSPYEITSPEFRDKIPERLNELQSEGRVLFETAYLKPDGVEIPIEFSSKVIEYEGKPAILTVARDISSRKKAEIEKKALEQQFFQAQKMESIGRLAGGIAHDFNNILTGIMGYAELLNIQFPDISTSEGQAADVILRSAERAVNLTKQLLGFARKGKAKHRPVNINSVIKDVVKVSEIIFEKKITVEYDLEKNLKPVDGDKNQFDQALTNLIINSKDAMPNGGKLIFSTKNIDVNEKNQPNQPEIGKGPYVLISITDTGYGIPAEIKSQIFEPFFTTKGEDKGTGLGLASVFGIIKNHKGFVYCDSEPGSGTTFSIYLPVSKSANKP